jgi:hypothetical protein
MKTSIDMVTDVNYTKEYPFLGAHGSSPDYCMRNIHEKS